MSCESREVHMSHLLHAQVLYVKCRCAASAIIIEDFSYMHTIGQQKRCAWGAKNIGAWRGGSDKIRCWIGFRRCRIRIRLVPAQIKPWFNHYRDIRASDTFQKDYVTVQKARDPIASEKQIVFIRQLQNTVEVRWAGSAGADSKHSGGADIIGSAGAVNPAVQSLQLGQRYTETRPGENSFRTWKTDTESKYTTTVKTIWQRTTETPARYRQCRRATPVTVLIT